MEQEDAEHKEYDVLIRCTDGMDINFATRVSHCFSFVRVVRQTATWPAEAYTLLYVLMTYNALFIVRYHHLNSTTFTHATEPY